MLTRMLLKSWAIGLLITIVLFGLSMIGTHTPLEVTFVFLVPALMLGETVGHGIAGRWTGGESSLALYGPMILAGSLIYGLIAFLVLRHRANKRRKTSPNP